MTRLSGNKDRTAPRGIVWRCVTFLREHRAAAGAGAGAVLMLLLIVAFFISGDDTPAPRRVQEITFVQITPPPPPPPPPEQQKPPEPEMIKQEQIVNPEVREEKPVEEPKDAPPDKGNDEPPGPLGLDQAPDGPGDNFNLAGRPGARGLLGPGGGATRWGWYASMVQQQIEAALRANAKTRNVVMQVQVRLWADGQGRVSRVQLVSSTGNPEVDAIIRTEVFAGLTLREPPPADMPMPMVTRITARRPS